ncbi:ABC transporter [Caloranaerobacter sp. TR13]|uniref:ABC transporter ATP-binding protein n=1 Tax=Caloranaerobacter sp. TR13 TaxID=1302151 RepID=UPI0006D3D889|nr:ABC transporter ATP-binding protein [Caloranaerobacter sp. TR13]KPU27690.1 ABC transporter [Caloranaerobacter sp. TR13]
MLKIENLTKKFGKTKAVDSISLEIKKGDIFGFVGPNGAGKTTTLKMIATLLKPTSGDIHIDGTSIYENVRETRSKIGYMPDFFGVYDNLKVVEYLEFYSDVAGIQKSEINKRIDEMLELVDLTDKKDEYVDNLSRGMKQRLCLARSLIHNPKLLILDEPASGLDPRARVHMKEILKELKNRGKTIIISSHILPELSELCTSLCVMEQGKIVISGTFDEIMNRVEGRKTIKIKVLESVDEAITFLSEETLVSSIKNSGNEIEFAFNGNEKDMANILKKLVTRHIPVVYFKQEELNLEEVFMKVTKGGEL